MTGWYRLNLRGLCDPLSQNTLSTVHCAALHTWQQLMSCWSHYLEHSVTRGRFRQWWRARISSVSSHLKKIYIWQQKIDTSGNVNVCRFMTVKRQLQLLQWTLKSEGPVPEHFIEMHFYLLNYSSWANIPVWRIKLQLCWSDCQEEGKTAPVAPAI